MKRPDIKKWKEIFKTVSEPPRAAKDLAALRRQWPKIKDKLPDGDGSPVLFLPGFLSTDKGMTHFLRECVEEKGYDVYGWAGGRNMGFDEETGQKLKKRLKDVYKAAGKKKVALVGHSLGGVYARELAREFPEMVSCVITLGSPFGMMDDADKGAYEIVRKAYDYCNPGASPLDDAGFEKRCLTPPPVPTTSVFSKQDGIVKWQASLNPIAPETENVEVTGSHVGMACNPLSVTVVLDRLAQDKANWQPFDKSKYPHAEFPENDVILPANPDHQHTKDQSIFKRKPGPKPKKKP